LFFYTWRFLAQLEHEAKNTALKITYRWFARVSIVMLPIAFLFFVPSFVIIRTKWDYAFNSGHEKEYDELGNKVDYFESKVFIIGSITALISCLILALVLCLVVQLSRKVKVGKDGVA